MNPQAMVYILNWVDGVLTIKSSEEQARWMLNVGKLIQSLILLIKLMLFFDWLDNSVLANFLWNELIVVAGKIA